MSTVPTESPSRRLARRAIAVLGIAGVLAAAAPVAEAAPAGEPAGAAAARSRESVPPPAATEGVVIVWNPASRRYEVPADQEAADLAHELQSVLAGDTGRRAGLAEKAAVEVLPNGFARTRIPAGFLSLSVLRPAGSAGFAPVCTQGPVGALRALAAPAVSAAPVDR